MLLDLGVRCPTLLRKKDLLCYLSLGLPIPDVRLQNSDIHLKGLIRD